AFLQHSNNSTRARARHKTTETRVQHGICRIRRAFLRCASPGSEPRSISGDERSVRFFELGVDHVAALLGLVARATTGRASRTRAASGRARAFIHLGEI